MSNTQYIINNNPSQLTYKSGPVEPTEYSRWCDRVDALILELFGVLDELDEILPDPLEELERKQQQQQLVAYAESCRQYWEEEERKPWKKRN